jgi:hypothetical protein
MDKLHGLLFVEPTFGTGKSHQKFMAASTPGTCKTMTEYAAFQVLAKVFFYVGRYRLTHRFPVFVQARYSNFPKTPETVRFFPVVWIDILLA